MNGEQPAGTGNTISGGMFYGPVIQGRDIRVTGPAPAADDARGQKVAGHVFISYVREDAGRVDRLQRALPAGIPVWRDTADLWPGEDWRARIRAAINDNALVFLACFSASSLARDRSYQNEELVLAIEQLRQRPPERPWLIPVRFDDCQIPDRDLGAGRTLSSIQRADLFGDRYDHGARRLVAAILRILGQDPHSVPIETEPVGGSAPPQDERKSWLTRGDSLLVGQSVYSPDGHTRFTLQDDANMVVFVDGLGDISDTGTVNLGVPKYLKLEDDGWLVLYDIHGNLLWRKGPRGARLKVQDNSHVVLYPARGEAIWATGAFIKAGVLVRWIPP